jgi:hypothetical protein
MSSRGRHKVLQARQRRRRAREQDRVLYERWTQGVWRALGRLRLQAKHLRLLMRELELKANFLKALEGWR